MRAHRAHYVDMTNRTETHTVAGRKFTEDFLGNRYYVNGKKVSRAAYAASWRDAKALEASKARTAEAEAFLASVPGLRK
jgi:hypothetical protein